MEPPRFGNYTFWITVVESINLKEIIFKNIFVARHTELSLSRVSHTPSFRLTRWPSFPGDRIDVSQVSTASALLVAGAGVKVELALRDRRSIELSLAFVLQQEYCDIVSQSLEDICTLGVLAATLADPIFVLPFLPYSFEIFLGHYLGHRTW